MKRFLKWTALLLLLGLLAGSIWGFIAYWRSTNDCDRKPGALVNPMKAIVRCEAGGPEVLTLADLEKPVPTDNQILVRVRALSLNPLDLARRGFLVLRPLTGMRKPKDTRVGVDSEGICVMAGIGGAGRLFGELDAYVRSRFTSQKFITYLARLDQADLTILGDLMRDGKVTPVIDKTYKLTDVPAALRHLETGHARGKIVVTID
jgi:NADPH:quinone reductase-like Zn-dependent oxidoreductase